MKWKIKILLNVITLSLFFLSNVKAQGDTTNIVFRLSDNFDKLKETITHELDFQNVSKIWDVKIESQRGNKIKIVLATNPIKFKVETTKKGYDIIVVKAITINNKTDIDYSLKSSKSGKPYSINKKDSYTNADLPLYSMYKDDNQEMFLSGNQILLNVDEKQFIGQKEVQVFATHESPGEYKGKDFKLTLVNRMDVINLDDFGNVKGSKSFHLFVNGYYPLHKSFIIFDCI